MIEDLPIQDQIEFSIERNLKINFQMADTPEFDFILFHPYALLDTFGVLSVVGLVERHPVNSATNYVAKLKLVSITFVEVLEINFEPNHALWNVLEMGGGEVLLKA